MNNFEIRDLSIKHEDKYILKDISLTVSSGEILGIVGESGSGKTMITKAVFGLLPEDMNIMSGNILLDNTDILTINKKNKYNILGNDISIIPQNPLSSLNPIIKVGKQMEECILVHRKIKRKEAKEIVLNTISEVGLDKKVYNSYPYELSGGMVQRILIGMSIINNPSIIIADEPTTALDVIVQFDILKLLKNIVKKREISLIFISHDLEVINYLCHNIFVIYGGHLMEYGNKTEIMEQPLNPYTINLLNSVPKDRYEIKKIDTDNSSIIDINMVGCPYCNRCIKAEKKCREEIKIVNIKGRLIKCMLSGE